MDCDASDGWLVFTTHVTAQDNPPHGIFDDPWSVWSERLATGEITRLARGYTSTRTPEVGAGLAIWTPPDSAYVIRSLQSSRDIPISGDGEGAAAAADGDRVAYVLEGKSSTTLTVGTVEGD